MPPSPLARLRKICLGFPDAHEVEAWGEPTFRVNNKLFAMFASGGTHHAEVDSVWIKATPVNQGFVIAAKPKNYFSPPYVGPRGWIGARLEGRVAWKEVADLLRDAYDMTLVKKKSAGTRRTRAASLDSQSNAKRSRRDAPARRQRL